MSEKRNKQIESVIHHHLSNYFLQNKDLFNENIIVSYIESNPKGTMMKVWVTYDNFVFKDGDDEKSYKYILDRINKYAIEIRSYIFDKVSMRIVPKLSFYFDTSGHRSDKLEELFNKIQEKN